MKKTEIDSVMSALCAYTKINAACRRLLKRQLCSNPCIDHVIHKLLNTDESRREYETLFSIVPPREMSSVVSESDSLKELRGAVDYHIHGIELLKEVTDLQVDYMTRLFFKMAEAVHPFYDEDVLCEFEPVSTKSTATRAGGKRAGGKTFSVKSPPPPRKKKIR